MDCKNNDIMRPVVERLRVFNLLVFSERGGLRSVMVKNAMAGRLDVAAHICEAIGAAADNLAAELRAAHSAHISDPGLSTDDRAPD